MIEKEDLFRALSEVEGRGKLEKSKKGQIFSEISIV